MGAVVPILDTFEIYTNKKTKIKINEKHTFSESYISNIEVIFLKK